MWQKAKTLPDTINFTDQHGQPLQDDEEQPIWGPMVLDEADKYRLAYMMLRHKQSLETIMHRSLQWYLRRGLRT